MSVSLAMIVRNEERTLARCLSPLRDAVDEIVVVDTGSTDATPAIAARFADRCCDFVWRDDFAAARQHAFDHATGDWVMWLDADDVVRHPERIRPLLDHAGADVAGFSWRYVAGRDAWGNSRCEFWRERCVRNDGTFRWCGRIHEVLVADGPQTTQRSGGIVVEHRPDLTRRHEKSRRNLEILEAELAANAGQDAARLLFYLGSEYAALGEIRPALEHLGRYLAVSTWPAERYIAQVRIAHLQRSQRDLDAAVEADEAALRLRPDWPEAYFGLATTSFLRADWRGVVQWCEVGRRLPVPERLLFIDPIGCRFDWIILYTNALYHLGRRAEALAWTKRALELVPDDPQHQANFLFFTRGAAAGAPATGVS